MEWNGNGMEWNGQPTQTIMEYLDEFGGCQWPAIRMIFAVSHLVETEDCEAALALYKLRLPMHVVEMVVSPRQGRSMTI